MDRNINLQVQALCNTPVTRQSCFFFSPWHLTIKISSSLPTISGMLSNEWTLRMTHIFKPTKLHHQTFPKQNDFAVETGQWIRFPNARCQMLLKIDATSKGIQPPFMRLLNPVSFEDQSADVLSNKKRSTFWFEKTLPGEFRTRWQGDCNVKLRWPSNALYCRFPSKLWVWNI